jgi:hypothetical protein
MNPYVWHWWFAWYPVRLTGSRHLRWLCWLGTRVVGGVAPNGDLADGWWQYRDTP